MTKTLEPSLEKLIALWLQIPVVGVLETENLTKMKRVKEFKIKDFKIAIDIFI